ncbi:MAG TPA: hypothetical protein VFM18_06825, partial [Methanosarcina sp.]|nr:hypothetical protein [Methanosarcina sp.]
MDKREIVCKLPEHAKLWKDDVRFNSREVAKIFDVRVNNMYRYIKEGRIPKPTHQNVYISGDKKSVVNFWTLGCLR